jgi:SAM-dependent methyltransferase
MNYLVKNIFKRLSTPKIRFYIKYVIRIPQAVIEGLTNKTEILVPPSTILFDGSYSQKQFIEGGNKYLNIFKTLGLINQDSRILDIGSGNGQKAVALTSYLSSNGSYEGFDIFKVGIDWSSKHITKRYPNFKFQYVDVYNKHYNPDGTIIPLDFKFPYPDNSFDFAFLVSVFTHMNEKEILRYLSEINRVLKIGGKCLATFFILNDAVIANMKANDTERPFPYIFDDFATINPEMPEDAIAFKQDKVIEMVKKAGFKEDIEIYMGTWSRTNLKGPTYDHQDFIVIEKK